MKKVLIVIALLSCFVQKSYCAEFNMFLNPGLIIATEYGDEKNNGHWGPSILIDIAPEMRLSDYASIGVGISQMFLNENDTPDAHANFTRFYLSSKLGYMKISNTSNLFGIARIGLSAYSQNNNYLFQDLGKAKSGLFWGIGLGVETNDILGLEVLYSQDTHDISGHSISAHFVSLSLTYRIL